MEKPKRHLDMRRVSLRGSSPPKMGATHRSTRKRLMTARRQKSSSAVRETSDRATVKSRRWMQIGSLVLACAMIGAGAYLAWLLIAPKVPALAGKSEIDLNTADDATDTRDRIQIEKINLEVPFFTGGPEELEKGSWHRFPDRGDPEQGGNFILSAHRFTIGTTPAETKKRSPFYNLDKLNVGDTLRIFFKGKWYNYTITKKYDVKPNQTEIEAPSETSKLTLYSCSLGGSSDGRIVLEATTKDGPETWQKSSAAVKKQSSQPKPKSSSKPSTTKKLTPEQIAKARQMLLGGIRFSRPSVTPKPTSTPTPSSTPSASPVAEPSASVTPTPEVSPSTSP